MVMKEAVIAITQGGAHLAAPNCRRRVIFDPVCRRDFGRAIAGAVALVGASNAPVEFQHDFDRTTSQFSAGVNTCQAPAIRKAIRAAGYNDGGADGLCTRSCASLSVTPCVLRARPRGTMRRATVRHMP